MIKQDYKSVYYKSTDNFRAKTITLSFNKEEKQKYREIKKLSSVEIRKLVNIETYDKLQELAKKEDRPISKFLKLKIIESLPNGSFVNPKEVTFIESKSIPFQRWYPYIEGYSLEFVKKIIAKYCPNSEHIYEPFAGTGTTIFAGDNLNSKVYFSEVNPLLQLLIETKIEVLKFKKEDRKKVSNTLLELKKELKKGLSFIETSKTLENNYSKVFKDSVYFDKSNLEQILKVGEFRDKVSKSHGERISNILNIAACGALLQSSYLKKAGDVRFKTPNELKKSPPKIFIDEFYLRLDIIIEDINSLDNYLKGDHEFLTSNAKKIGELGDVKFDAVITSPPYLNGTNYFRNTKLELWFLEILKTDKDLRYFRNEVLTSGINDVTKENRLSNKNTEVIEKSLIFKNTLTALKATAYDSRIPTMAESYFSEMYDVFHGLRSKLKPKARLAIDIGDSIFSGTHIKTDMILIEVLESLNYNFIKREVLRQRRSRGGELLSQVLLVFEFGDTDVITSKKDYHWRKNWQSFKEKLPHQEQPFSKKNWGHKNHSLCSYQGKLKPSIGHFLTDIFVPESGSFLDIFSGVGTIPFEGALQGKKSYGFDISLPAYTISSAKVVDPNNLDIFKSLNELEDYITSNKVSRADLIKANKFGYNKTLKEYYESDTFKEILLARKYYRDKDYWSKEDKLIITCIMHILHGNRPYALSRRSHPITPYAPSGLFEYKNLITKVKEKIARSSELDYPDNFQEGNVYLQDCTKFWPIEIDQLDAIITSPPFFESTKFYLTNWIRMWFAGWEENDFKNSIKPFVEVRQKNSFDIYEPIFRQAKERLKKDGVFVLHLGKSHKCDMAEELTKVSKKWFKKVDLFDESVIHVEKHGIKDKGSVSSHQYLILG